MTESAKDHTLAVYGPTLRSFDYVAMENALAPFLDRLAYIVPGGEGFQGIVALYLYMRCPKADIRVVVPPDPRLLDPWWYDVPDLSRVSFIRARGNSVHSIGSSLMRESSELLAFCEFDECFIESERGDDAYPWRMVEQYRRVGKLATFQVLRSPEESSGYLRAEWLSYDILMA